MAVFVGLAACGVDPVLVTPVIDTPDPADNASVSQLRQIVVAVAHAGDPDNIVSQTVASGQTIELTGIPFADDLVIHMTGDTDVAYGRTCPFAIAADGPVPSPHLFFSRQVKFASMTYLPEERVGGWAATFHDGSALLIGGTSTSGDVVDLERYDPSTNLSSVVGQLAARKGAVVAEFGIVAPQLAVIGGDDGTGGAPFFELVDLQAPATRVIERVDDIARLMGRVGVTATTLSSGEIVVIGGSHPSGQTTGLVELISPAAGGTPMVQELPHAMLAQPRMGHTATKLGNDAGAKVLIVGGADSLDVPNVPVATAELFRPFTRDVVPGFAPMMAHPRSRHHAELAPDGSVLIIGGVDKNGTGVVAIEQFSFETGFVDTQVALAPGGGVVDFTTTILPDGRILLIGGIVDPVNAPGVATNTAWIIEQQDNAGAISLTISAADPLAVPRAGHQATLLCDGTVLVTGGTDGSVAAERYNPPPLGRR
jgi:hypothetical protein